MYLRLHGEASTASRNNKLKGNLPNSKGCTTKSKARSLAIIKTPQTQNPKAKREEITFSANEKKHA